MIGAVSPRPFPPRSRRPGGAAVATLLLAGLCGAAPAVRAEAPDPDAWPRPSLAQLQIGGALSWRPTYPGSDRMGWGLRPVVALQWGRLRLSSSQANLIESPADGSRTAGASLSLLDTPAWSSGVALRWDNGRDVVLAGDAAGVVAPASGEGIYYAMLGGRLAAQSVDELIATGDVRVLARARRRFMREHGRVFWVLGLMQRVWYANDARRERFVSICRDRDVQQLTFDAYMNKRLVRSRPLAHVRIFFKDLAHWLGLVRA